MFAFLSEVLSDKKGGIIFTCFSAFHIALIFAFVCLAVLACVYVIKKGNNKKRVIDFFINLAFGLYILDFFLMPFAYGKIDVEKLPFHVCTAMCVTCFLSWYNSFFAKFKLQFAMLGFLSNLIYLIYPAGVMWHAVHPLSYRVIQTLVFHGVMVIYGALVLVCESKEFDFKKCYKDLAVIFLMTAWAWFGNTLYNNQSVTYNWFFVVRDPFNMLSAEVAPYVMPALNIVVFFLAELLIYFIFSKLTKRLGR
ncbi:MAG: YwaF family protein [Clostridia bacterium]|nr:YwaF family protein [Clostridia bacterium]